MSLDRQSRVARRLLIAATVSLGVVLLRNLGVVSPVFPGVWDNAYGLTEFLGVTVCGLRAVSAPRGERAAWLALTLGLFGYAAADVYYTVALENLASPPFPSLADAGYLSIYPAAYIALVRLLRARGGRAWAGLWLDGLVCGLAVASFGAALVFSVVAQTDGPLATVATNLAYPLGDLTMIAFVIGVLTITGRRPGSTWLLLGAAFAVWAVADTVYLYETAIGSYREYTLLDSAWPAAYLLIGLAAWRPARRVDARRLRGRLLILPAASTLAALGLLVLDHYSHLNAAALWLACAAVAAAVLRFALTFRENLKMLSASEAEATTDPLTGLRNRRALMRELERAAADARPDAPALLALFDLDGFKGYNDTFGHPAGDALLARLGERLTTAIAGEAHAYRMGGDEFCLLATRAPADALTLLDRASRALSESGERFAVRCSRGAVLLSEPGEDPVGALRLADQRMYADKRTRRPDSDEAVHRVLLRVAAEHDNDLREHVDDVARLADAVGRELGLDDAELIAVRRAAQLHDIGKVAIPDAILQAPRALTETEWQFMRRHTIIGARIIATTPELDGVAKIVRSSHERYDGRGYPDGLAGEDIPLGARIVSICDAYDAMVTTRAYRSARPPAEALAELEACAGGQFDPRVVAAFIAVHARRSMPGVASLSALDSHEPAATPRPGGPSGARRAHARRPRRRG